MVMAMVMAMVVTLLRWLWVVVAHAPTACSPDAMAKDAG